ncbi:MAG TPA: DUF1588 domain-containing protein [Polyangiaceae bacterium]|nr:DUF1588 domain-containing protein [Polyangiaceae bacterium]
MMQASFLTSGSLGTDTSPSARGARIAESLLCAYIPPAHGEFPLRPSESSTMRQRLEVEVARSTACAACHKLMDTLGLAFEHFDAVGNWRDTDHGLPIDTQGTVEPNLSFTDALDLVQQLGKSRDASRCFASKWMSYAYGRRELDQPCLPRALSMIEARSGWKLRDLVLALTQTEDFLYRQPGEP